MFRQVKRLRSEFIDPVSNEPSGDEALRKPLTSTKRDFRWDVIDETSEPVRTSPHNDDLSTAAFDSGTDLAFETVPVSENGDGSASGDPISYPKSIDDGPAQYRSNSSDSAFAHETAAKGAASLVHQNRPEPPAINSDAAGKDIAAQAQNDVAAQMDHTAVTYAEPAQRSESEAPDNAERFTETSVAGHEHENPEDLNLATERVGDAARVADIYNDKPVYSLDKIYENFFREGAWGPDELPNSFSFPSDTPSGYSSLSGIGKTFSPFSILQRSTAEYAMEQLDGYLALEFTNGGLDDDGDIRFANTEGGNEDAAAFAKGPWTISAWDGDIWVRTPKESNFDFGIGNAAFTTLIHEIGHAMGLKHPGEYNAGDGANYDDDAAFFQDSKQFTIMSYFSANNTSPGGAGAFSKADTFLLHDVYALQRKYGADMTTRTGDTTYGFNSNAGDVFDLDVNSTPRYTIWDAGGYDTWDFSEAANPVDLDLRSGSFSSIGGGINNLSIAYDHFASNPAVTWIESAIGGAGDDTIDGNDAANTLGGRGGADLLYGGVGEDHLDGGDDGDTLFGGAGDDYIHGDVGDDDLYGGSGDDDIFGGGQSDTMYAGAGDDDLKAGAGDDRLINGAGNDTLDGGLGFDTAVFTSFSNPNSGDWTIDLGNGLNGSAVRGSDVNLLVSIEGIETGEGDDSIIGAHSANRVITADGADTVFAQGGDDTIVGGNDDDQLYGGTGDDEVRGGSADFLGSGDDGQDIVDGYSGDDTLYGGSESDYLYGGSGNDTLYGGTDADWLFGGSQDDLIVEFTGIWNTSGQDGDWVDAGYGDDTVILMGTDDTIYGGHGNDDIQSGNGEDLVGGGAGDDLIEAGGNDDTVLGGLGADDLFGGSGIDELDFTDVDADWHIDMLLQAATTEVQSGADHFVDFENIRTGDGNDTVSGDHFSNDIWGGDGLDSLKGRAGNDLLFGGKGSDTISGGGGDDLINGGSGTDTADYGNALSGVLVVLSIEGVAMETIGAGTDTLISIENVIGSAFGDGLGGDDNLNLIYGRGGGDVLFGFGGSDRIYGGSGDDLIEGGSGYDLIYGGAGRDAASYATATSAVSVDLAKKWQDTEGAGNDMLDGIEDLIGSTHDDHLYGNDGANRLTGGDGDDMIDGRAGLDTLFGGAGDDVFYSGVNGNSLDGGSGQDWVSYARDGVVGVTIDLDLGQQWTGLAVDDIHDIENVLGTIHDDEIRGDEADNRLVGASGDDILFGAGGDDTLEGWTGDDKIYIGVEVPPSTPDEILVFPVGEPEPDQPGDDAALVFDLIKISEPASALISLATSDLTLSEQGTAGTAVGAVAAVFVPPNSTGADTVVFQNNWGSDEIFGFAIGVDSLDFSAVGGIDDVIDLEINDVEGGVSVSFDGSDVLIHDQTKATLSSDDFMF